VTPNPPHQTDEQASEPFIMPARVILITSRRRWVDELAGVWTQRDLVLMLALRDIKLRYRQTALGVVWVVLQPLLVSGLFSFVFGSVARLPTNGVPYFLFAFSGLVGWNLFANALGRASIVMINNSPLVSKIYFPRVILPISSMLGCLLDLLVAFNLMVILVFASGRSLTPALATLPLWLLLLLALTAGVCFAAAGLVVRFRDVQYVVPLLVQVLILACPVAYASSAVPHRFRAIYQLNPMTALIDGIRWSFLGIGRPSGGATIAAGIVTLVVLAIGLDVFRRAEAKFADVI
jgi:lipopolysaccharide transport system permease protein